MCWKLRADCDGRLKGRDNSHRRWWSGLKESDVLKIIKCSSEDELVKHDRRERTRLIKQ